MSQGRQLARSVRTTGLLVAALVLASAPVQAQPAPADSIPGASAQAPSRELAISRVEFRLARTIISPRRNDGVIFATTMPNRQSAANRIGTAW